MTRGEQFKSIIRKTSYDNLDLKVVMDGLMIYLPKV